MFHSCLASDYVQLTAIISRDKLMLVFIKELAARKGDRPHFHFGAFRPHKGREDR